MARAMFFALCAALSSCLLATTVNSDIASNATWNHAGSPYQITGGSGGAGTDLLVKSGATLTIDASGGSVDIEFIGKTNKPVDVDFDMVIGNGSGSTGALVINASGGAVTFKFKTGDNLRVTSYGSLNITDATNTTIFTRYTGYTGGAVIFEASQTVQSSLKNCSFSYMGNDSQDGALYIKSSATYVPTLENMSFDNCTTSAIRMDGNGINVLKEGNLKPPFNVSTTTYVLYFSAVTSTANSIVFPDPDQPDSPLFKLTGTCQVGDSSNESHWRFKDGCTFKCATSSKVKVVRGSVWGSSEAQPVFRSEAGSPGYTDWSGLEETESSYANTFGDVGPFAYVTVRDASTGVKVEKNASPYSLNGKTMRLTGLTVKHCYDGASLNSTSGGVIGVEAASVGAASGSGDEIYEFGTGMRVIGGVVRVQGSTIIGGSQGLYLAGKQTGGYSLTIRDSALSTIFSNGTALNCGATSPSYGPGSVLLDHTKLTSPNGLSFNEYTASSTFTLTMSHCFVGAGGSGANLAVPSTSTMNVLIEDTTFLGTGTGGGSGLRGQQIPSSGSSAIIRRSTISNYFLGSYFDDGASNTVEYVFEDCLITGNGYGIRDYRTQTARVVANHCSFQGNTTYGAYDASGGSLATNMLAENCYWGAANGPGGSGPGSGDAINTYVDAVPFLARPAIGWLIGGCPAGVSALGVNNATGATTYADQLHIIDDNAFAVTWTFAADFFGSTQSAYEIDINTTMDFTTPYYNGAKTTSSATDIGITPDLAAGTVYYLRLKLWDASDRAGPAYFHTFRLNKVPPKIGNTNRTPINGNAITDATPPLIFEKPTDDDEDGIHFRIEIDDDVNFGSVNVTIVSSTTLSAFEVSTDQAATWRPLITGGAIGAPTTPTTRIRCTIPAANALANGTWYWRVRATDGFENGAWSDTTGITSQSFALTRSYQIDGQAVGASTKAIAIARNGTIVAGESATTDSLGNFSLTTMTDDFREGDEIVIFINESSMKGAILFRFSGQNMVDSSGPHKKVTFNANTVVFENRFAQALTTTPQASSSTHSYIPWTFVSGSRIQFASTVAGAGKGVVVRGLVSTTSRMDCNANDVEFTVDGPSVLAGRLVCNPHVDGPALLLHKLTNYGDLDVLPGSTCLIDGLDSICAGPMRLISATLQLEKSTGMKLTIENDVTEIRDSTVTAGSGETAALVINSAGSNVAVLDCTGTVFVKASVVVEADGRIAEFKNNTFSTSGTSQTSGTASFCTGSTMTVFFANWTTNAFAGMTLRMGTTAGNYRFYDIVSNTATVITVASEYNLGSDGWTAGSSYAVYSGLPPRYIRWKCTEPRSITAFHGIQFYNTLGGHNVEADSGNSILALSMIAAGGATAGATWERDSGNKVTWGYVPPVDIASSRGDTRVRVSWLQDAQTSSGVLGYNVYESKVQDGGKWTSAPNYNGITTEFIDLNTNFQNSGVAAGDKFYPTFSTTTELTVYSVSGTSVFVAGNQSGAAASGDTYSFFFKKNGTLVPNTSASFVATNLTNNVKYYYYVTIDDSTEDEAPYTRIRSAQTNSTPTDSSIELLSPSATKTTSENALTIVGKATHWDASATVGVTGGAGTAVVHDIIPISPTLILADVTLSGSTNTTWSVAVTRNDVWYETSYDEVESANLTATFVGNHNRATLAFSTNNGGIAADANTSNAFTFNVDFTDQGGGVDPSKFEVYASRSVTLNNNSKAAGLELIAQGLNIDVLSSSRATCTINQTGATELFANGEYTLTVRVGNNNSEYSEWASRRFYVEGASASVVKVKDSPSGGPVKLLQGTTMNVVLTGTGLSDTQTVDFGSNITVNSKALASGELTVNLTVDHLAACGPRDFTTNNGAKTGSAIVEYPTNILPTTTNAEPARNPAVGGVNVFLVNGEFFRGETDISTRGRMMGITWSRHYRSKNAYNGPLGFNWMGHYYQRAVYDSGSGDIFWYTPDGRREVFPDVTGGFSSPAGVYVRAERETTYNTITLTDRHGSKCVFNAEGRLWQCIDRNTNTVTCTYLYSGQLDEITDDRAKKGKVVYYGHGRVQKYQDKVWNTSTPREVEYSYDSSGNLIEHKAPTTDRYDGSPLPRIAAAYRYDSSHRLTECINPREYAQGGSPVSYLENRYDILGYVVAQRLGGQNQWYDMRYPSSTFVITLDPRGLRTDFTLDASGHTTKVKRFTGIWAADTDDPYYGYGLTAGTASSAPSATVLTDSSKNWVTNAYTGFTLRMGTGGTDHQDYKIVSNTSTTITIDTLSSLSGDGWTSGSAYAVYSAHTQTSVKLRAGDPTSYLTIYTYDAVSAHEVSLITKPLGNKVAYTYPGTTTSANDTADSCSANELNDTSHAGTWSTDQFKGMTLRIGTNAGNYRYYPIISNTNTKITVDAAFSLQGDGWSNSTYYVYNDNVDPLAAGNVLTSKVDNNDGNGSNDLVTTYTYEPRYQFVKTVKDPNGNTTTYTYDYELSYSTSTADAGNLVSVQSPSMIVANGSSQQIITRTTYNEFGQPVTATDGMGNVTFFKYYTADGHVGFLYQRISAWGELDLTSEYEYDNVGNLTISWPPRAFEAGVTKDDFKTTYEVNELNQTWHVTGSKMRIGGGERIDSYFYFDANGNQTSSVREYTTDSGSAMTNPTSGNELDPDWFAGQKATTPMTATWVESRTEYNLLNLPTSRTVDAIAGTTITKYTTSTVYDVDNNVTDSISALGNRSRAVYDERNMAYKRTSGADSDAAGTYMTNYDANGRVSTSVDAVGNVTTYAYDGFDRTTQVTDPAGHYTTSTYDLNGNVEYSRSYDNANTLLTESKSYYDKINRVWKTERTAKDCNGNAIGDGLATNITLFDMNSRTVWSKDDNGVMFFTYYDGASRVMYTRDAMGNEVWPEYNSHGAVKKRTYREVNGLTNAQEISHEEFDLDLADRVIKYRDQRFNAASMDTETESKYDGWSRVTQTTDAASVTTDFTFDLLSRSVRTTRKPVVGTESTWIVTDNLYDADSRVLKRTVYETGDDTTPTGPQNTEYTYDERNRLLTLRRADGDIWTYSYDENSNQKGWHDPMGTDVINTFNSRNMIAYRSILRGVGVQGPTYEYYEYDGAGRLTSCSNYDGAKLVTTNAWRYNTLSMAESLDQTVADPDGKIVGTWTSKSEYDATGFNTATIFSDSRRVEHSPDMLNRLLCSFDVTNNKLIASYIYAGTGRLIERTYGNGVRTNWSYEDSGCGCGGKTSYCTRVESKYVGYSDLLYQCDRRYDVTGNVTAERRGHEGGRGNVFRYDSAYRLKDAYVGVDMYDNSGADDLNGMASPGATPSVFGTNISYAMDTRGNRAGSTGTELKADTLMSGTYVIYGTNYSATDTGVDYTKMNQYAKVDGQAFSYNAADQMTVCGTSATHKYAGYDYKGQTSVSSSSSLPSSVDGFNQYDCQGRKSGLFQEGGSGGPYPYAEIQLYSPSQGRGCSCSSGKSDTKSEIRIFKDSGSGYTALSFVQYVIGMDVTAPGSGSGNHPATAATPSLGSGNGNAIVQEKLPTAGEVVRELYILHDQLGSTCMTTNVNGNREDEYNYDPYGQALQTHVMIDGHPRNISSKSNDGSGNTSVTFTNPLPGGTIIGAEIRVARPTQSSDRLLFATVSGTSGVPANTILFSDPSNKIYNAINGTGVGLVVLALYQNTSSGTWYAAPWYDATNDLTEFYGEAGLVSTGVMAFAGATLVPDVQKAGTLTIYSVTWNGGSNNDIVRVKGRATALGASGGRFHIHVAARQRTDPNNVPDLADPAVGGSYYLYAGYRYHASTGEALSHQPNSGWYYCWNRMYDPLIGRFTSPDPAATPWSNLQDYASSSPVALRDPSGLKLTVSADVWNSFARDALNAICPSTYTREADGTISAPADFCDRKEKRKEWESCGGKGKNDMGRWVEKEVLVEGSWRKVEGHAKGCELISSLICSACDVAIVTGNPSQYKPDRSKSFGENGFGGKVQINVGEPWHTWQRQGGVWVESKGTSPVSAARATAHELAHALRGCDGSFKIGKPELLGDWNGTEGFTSYDGATIDGYQNLNAQEIKNKHKFMYGDREEYDTINQWENPIAAELGEQPRFAHR